MKEEDVIKKVNELFKDLEDDETKLLVESDLNEVCESEKRSKELEEKIKHRK